MKVRCSNGLQVSGYHGNFVQHTFGADLEIGAIDADKAIGVVFSYDGKLDPKLDAHFQAALLYTSANGQRRVRCINTVAAVNEGGMETMKFVDQDAVVAMVAKDGMFALSAGMTNANENYSGLQDPRQVPQGHPGKRFREDGGHLQRIPQDLLRISSSRTIGVAREPERVLDVHAQPDQVAGY